MPVILFLRSSQLVALISPNSALNPIEISYNINIQICISNKIMPHLLVSKWGNSLAVRIPTEFIRQTNLKDGDQLEIHIGADGSLCLQKNDWNRKAFAAELSLAQESLPIGYSVIDALRHQARY